MQPSTARHCVVCTKYGNLIFEGGCPVEKIGNFNSLKFCKLAVALKSLAPTEQFITVEMGDTKAIVLEHLHFLTCVIVPKIDCFEKFVLVFDALQITHFLEMFYSKELNA